MNAAVEIIDLAIDVALSRRQWDGREALLPASVHGRGSDRVGNGPDTIFTDEARQALKRNGAIDRIRGACRQQTRREQIALAGRDELRAFKNVDVLVDDLADPDHHVVTRRGTPLGARRQRAAL